MTGLDWTTRPVPRAVVIWVGALIVACDSSGDAPYRAASTVRMADRLDSLARAMNANPTVYENAARVAAFRDRRVESDLRSQLLHHGELAEELLRAGQSLEATKEFEEIRRRIATSGAGVPPRFATAIDKSLGLAYLRVGQHLGAGGLHLRVVLGPVEQVQQCAVTGPGFL